MSYDDDKGNEPVEIDQCTCQKLSDSGKALKVFWEDEAYWVPISQILEESQIKKPGDWGTLVVPQWLAAEKFGVYE